MSQLNQLPNIGSILENKLISVGVKTSEDLIKLGSKEVFNRIKLNDPEACLNSLYAIEGAVQSRRWHDLTKEEKRELRDYYQSL
ncbi:TfoX/Sxy family protein [Vallitalea okinawensis]|uniref:TfoX/Sxy family protein n=1 Tax=Vallitalea okinawensis TaxID=2078660 RepID=UPI000CFBFF67|nr:TfoX/Sxy family protein [Vallitalea okinawensis]